MLFSMVVVVDKALDVNKGGGGEFVKSLRRALPVFRHAVEPGNFDILRLYADLHSFQEAKSIKISKSNSRGLRVSILSFQLAYQIFA